MTAEELAPCPFCGSTDIYRYSRERMTCGTCYTRGPIALSADVSPEQIWNRQAAHRAGVVEGLRRLLPHLDRLRDKARGLRDRRLVSGNHDIAKEQGVADAAALLRDQVVALIAEAEAE